MTTTSTSARYAVRDLVIRRGNPEGRRLCRVLEVHDDKDFGVLYELREPGRSPAPYEPDEIQPATLAELQQHHVSWFEALGTTKDHELFQAALDVLRTQVGLTSDEHSVTNRLGGRALVMSEAGVVATARVVEGLRAEVVRLDAKLHEPPY